MTNRCLFVGAVAALTLVASACDPDKVTSVNNNPNNPTDAPSTALFTNASRNAVGRWLDGVGGTRYAFLSQHFAEVQYPESDQYLRLRASSTSGLFDNSYSNELQDLELVARRGEAADAPGLYGPARILQAWEFGILTDVFGDIPYSQAFKADSGILSPEYDEQANIYESLFTTLDEVSSALTSADNELGDADPIYGGDPDKWQRFANSLHARHALRLVNVDPGTASAELQAAFAAPGGLITSNADNAKLTWPGDGVYDNPWASNFKGRDDHRISSRLLTYLRDYTDPRLPVYAMPAEVDAPAIAGKTLRYCPSGSPPCYVGLFNALLHADAQALMPNTSRAGEVFFPGVTAYGTFGGNGSKFPSFLMTAAEVEFIRAEAAERGIGGLTPAQARGFYESAIRLSMEMWGISNAAIVSYLAAPGVAYNTAGTTEERQTQIAIQKWLALYIDPIQAWSEIRRTCQPAIVKPGPEAVVSQLPRRLYYSNTESAVNEESYSAAVARQGTDNFLTRIYWDEAPEEAPTWVSGCNVR